MSAFDLYILNGHEPISEPDVLTWARWFETSYPARVVAQTEIPGGVVSTVFLGINHNWFGGGRPMLFETMVFIDGGDDEQTQPRCATWDEAVAQHAAVLEQIHQRRLRR